MTEQMSVSEKATRAFNMLILMMKLAKANRERVKNIQIENGFTKQRVARMHILDADKHFTMKIADGLIVLYQFTSPDPDVEIVIERLCTFKHLRKGYRFGIHPGTGAVVKMTYSPLDAWKYGDVRTYGAASTNDTVAFFKLFRDIVSMISEEDITKICGSCEHGE